MELDSIFFIQINILSGTRIKYNLLDLLREKKSFVAYAKS